MRRLAVVFVCLLALAGALVIAWAGGHGDASGSAPEAARTPTDTTAVQATLTAADLPADWQQQWPPGDLRLLFPGMPDAGCNYLVTPDDVTDAAEYAEATYAGPDEDVLNVTWRFDSADAARSLFDDLAAAYEGCRDGIVAASKTAFAADGANAGLDAQFSVKELALPLDDAQTRAYRVSAAISGAGNEVQTQVIDIAILRSGTLVALLGHTSASEDESTLRVSAELLAHRMSGRLR